MKMLSIEELILLNQYAQDIVEREQVLGWFSSFGDAEKADILGQVWELSVQAKAVEEDISLAVVRAKIKPTHTPVIMLYKGNLPFRNRGYRLKQLKGVELEQAFSLVLECFVISEQRRKKKCDIDKKMCNHWWHEDLSNPAVVKKILNNKR